MRILILGNGYSAKSFFNLFNRNKDNIVFSNIENCNFEDFKDINDVIEFIEANDINFVLITDEEYVDLSQMVSSNDVTVFAPDLDAITISTSKADAKRFMYKNSIPTPCFQFFEKQAAALEFVKNIKNPIAIKPDNHSATECTQFAETSSGAQKIIKNFFASGNKKVIIEDYVEGKNIEFFILSDGFKFQILGISAKYQNNIAYFEPKFVNNETIEKIKQEIISPTIDALQNQGSEYIGILGFDIILKNDNSFYLVGYNSFFDDIDVDFYTQGFEVDWLKIFESTVIGDVFAKYEIKPKSDYMITIREKDEINFINAKTKCNLELFLEELYDIKEYKEAEKLWKS